MTYTIVHFDKLGPHSRRAKLVVGPIETKYGLIEIFDWGDNELVLNIDGTTMSVVNTENPSKISSEYIQEFVKIFENLETKNNILHLGVAGGTFASYIASTSKDTKQIGVDINEELINIAREHLNLPKSPVLKVRIADASTEINNMKDEKFDLIVMDCFNSKASIPEQFMSKTFYDTCLAKLKVNGKFTMNIIDNIYTPQQIPKLIKLFDNPDNCIIKPLKVKGLDEINYILTYTKTF